MCLCLCLYNHGGRLHGFIAQVECCVLLGSSDLPDLLRMMAGGGDEAYHSLCLRPHTVALLHDAFGPRYFGAILYMSASEKV